jgi:competence protein ComEC
VGFDASTIRRFKPRTAAEWWARAQSRLRHALALQAGRFVFWLPVAVGAGSALYLNLPFEPAWPWILAPLGLFLAAWISMRHVNANAYALNVLVLLLLASSGMVLCKLRAEHVRAPVLATAEGNTFSVTAFVVDNVSSNDGGARLILAPIRIRGVDPDHVPLRIRVSLRPGTLEATGIKPGDAISVFALLNPPPAPNIPGGFDFAQGAWFQGIGAVGFVPGTPRLVYEPVRDLRLDLILKLNRLRWDLTRAIATTIAPAFGVPIGGFAAALVTGDQAYIPQTMVQSMRDSGLAHILSISGVHMAIVGGFAFFGLRLIMASIPWLALRVPVKKVAAALSILCVLAYLAISGAPAPAVRSAVVAVIAFSAMLLDRRALSLRALAIAAMVVIALTPEAVVQPGFLMSFLATAALLALAETVTPPIREISVPRWVRFIQSAVHGAWLSLQASIVATAATTPFAIAYFNRFTLYGLFSNLFEAPITGALVMPPLAIGTVFVGTPIAWVALRIAGFGLWLIRLVSDTAAALPGAVIDWSSAPAYVLPLSTAGILWVCLIRGRLRWLGLVAAFTILYWPRLQPPDVWIDPEGGNAAVRTASGAYVLRPKVRQYGFQQWTQHYGLKRLDTSARDGDYECTAYACYPLPNAKLRVGFWFSRRPPKDIAMATLCLNSDLVIMRNDELNWPEECKGVNHITAPDLARLGAMELTRTRTGWSIIAAQPLRGHRYWSAASEAEGTELSE